MLFRQLFGSLAAFASLAKAVNLTGYEYVIVGSGAGGGVSFFQPGKTRKQSLIRTRISH